MARVTVEDCIVRVDNRFELVLMAAHRARLIYNGEPSTVEKDNDKPPVIALREIAIGSVPTDQLREDVIKSFQEFSETEDQEIADQNEETSNSQQDNLTSKELSQEKTSTTDIFSNETKNETKNQDDLFLSESDSVSTEIPENDTKS